MASSGESTQATAARAADTAPLPEDGFERLIAVMARLRDPTHGCPWDLEQSLDSLKPYLIEETYEALDAIDALGAASRAVAADPAVTATVAPDLVANHRDELGDVLLQVAFQSQLAEEFGWFTVDDVARGIANKMERRHPHVFAPAPREDVSEARDGREPMASRAITADEVMTQWQQIKATEGQKVEKTGILAGVPRQLPALLRGQRIGQKVAHIGFDWPQIDGALAKVDEELLELREALAGEDLAHQTHELGDVLFALTSVARHAGIDAEQALRTALDRFQARFEGVERRLQAHTASLPAAQASQQPDLDTLERWWQASKAENAAAEGRPADPSSREKPTR